eukprot:jgi/Chlat1/5175/Chrsp33S05043
MEHAWGRRAAALSAVYSLLLLSCGRWHLVEGLTPSSREQWREGEYGPSVELELFQLDKDPRAKLDSFELLPQSSKRAWARDDGSNMHTKAAQLAESLDVTVGLEIKLVGFDGDGNGKVELRPENFDPFLEAIQADVQASVINTPPHHLLVKPKLVLHFSEAAPQLATYISNEIAGYLTGYKTPEGHISAKLAELPHTLVDKLIAKEPSRSRTTYTLYLLNPKSQTQPYAYYYEESGTPLHSCMGSLWVSKEQRYAWLDLTAGPVSYGPQSARKGFVQPQDIPRVTKYRHSQHQKELVTDLITLIWSACEHLISPPLSWYPVWHYDDTEVRIVHVAVDEDSPRHSGPAGLSTRILESQLSGLAVLDEKLRVTTVHTSFGMCDFCVAAYAHALKAHTSNVVRGGAVVHDYLDALELHYWLKAFQRDITREIGIRKPGDAGAEGNQHAGLKDPSKANTRVLPVYIFDVTSNELLLLDRHHQVVAFDDMVLVVRSNAGESIVDFSCNDEVVLFNPRVIARQVLAGVLQAGWGVNPTHVIWDAQQQRPSENYLWSVGNTPFGPLSSIVSVSFAQRDAAHRNLVYTYLNETAGEAMDLLNEFARYGNESRVMTHSQHYHFVQRWNVLRHKLHQATYYLSLNNQRAALYYALSARHDLVAVEQLLTAAAADVTTAYFCYMDASPTSYWWHIILLAVTGVLVGFVYKMCVSSKRKQF